MEGDETSGHHHLDPRPAPGQLDPRPRPRRPDLRRPRHGDRQPEDRDQPMPPGPRLVTTPHRPPPGGPRPLTPAPETLPGAGTEVPNGNGGVRISRGPRTTRPKEAKPMANHGLSAPGMDQWATRTRNTDAAPADDGFGPRRPPHRCWACGCSGLWDCS